MQNQLNAVQNSTPIARQMERAGRMTWFPDLDGCPEWLAGSLLSYPSESQAIKAAKGRKEFIMKHLEDQIKEAQS